MRSRLFGMVVAIGLIGLPAAQATTFSTPSDQPLTGVPAAVPGISPPIVTSDNVTYHGTIPIDSPGVGGEVVNHADGRTYFYVTGLKGLSIYDVTDDPTAPVPTGFLPFPHAQNEDLKVSDDGTRAMISADGALLLPIFPTSRGIHIIDTTDPEEPVLLGSTETTESNHTAECADAKCEWIYGSTTGAIYDATDPTDIKRLGQWNVDRNGVAVSGRHALNRDDSGLLISDSNPRLVLDPRDDPANPVLLAQGRSTNADTRLQHNNVRPDSAEWVARDHDDPADEIEFVTVEPNARSVSVTNERPVMRAGEIMIGNSESNLNPTCSNAGGLSTWSMVDFEKGADMKQLEVFRPLNGTTVDGSPAVNALGCSGHWFTENDGIVAASWYEHGVRFFDVDKSVGTIEEIGYFQPIATQAGAAYWVSDTVVYNVDYARGIDILSFDRGAEEPTQKELDRSWLRNLGTVGKFAAAERYFCGLGGSN